MRADPRPAFIALALAWAGCGGIEEPGDPNHCKETYCVGGQATAVYVPAPPPSPMDLLVVLDDSVAAGPYAARLESALRELAANTESLSDGLIQIDLNVASLPAAVGAKSASMRLWPEARDCPQPSGPFLHAARLCDNPSNFRGELADALACAALHLPATGQSPRPLEAIRTFLGPGGLAETSSFRRKSANLLLAIVSSEDDPTIVDGETLAGYRDFLGAVVEHPDDAIVTGVVAPATAQGLSAFGKSFGENGALSDITAADWPAMPFVTDRHLIRDSFPNCLDWPLDDADPSTEGIQPNCVVSEMHYSSGTWTEEILPHCSDNRATPSHCWKTSRDPQRCAANTFEFVVEPTHPACLSSDFIKYNFTCATRYQ